jgi:CheY-like chemotaxis protein
MDITESKQTEEALHAAKEAAEAANKAKDNFLAILSHELRTPLTPVLATLAMIEEDPSVPRHIQRDLAMIRRNVELEARLIDDLLDVTRISRGKLELNRQVVDARTLLEHAMQNYCAPEATKKSLSVEIDADAEETYVLADSSRLTQVFWNLLQNACKFTPRNGRIQVTLRNERSESAEENRPDLVIEIRDDGIGIDPQVLPRIFDAFEQGERSRSRLFGGLGLGLAISRALVELHGGSIVATSEGKDKGSQFTIRLGTVPKPARDLQRTPGNEGIAKPVGEYRPLRILLVEDHADTAIQLSRLLKKAGHQVTWASSIQEARTTVAGSLAGKGIGSGFDLIISDLGLPDGTGHELMRELSSRHRLPAIALSGYGLESDVQESLDAGFSCHLTKPVDWAELKQAILQFASAGSEDSVLT